MTHENSIIAKVKDMDEVTAKELLAQIFLNVSRANSTNYKSDKAFEDIRKIYSRNIVKPMVFDKK